MAAPLDSISLIPAVVAVISLLTHYRLARLSDAGLFAYGLLIAASIAIAALVSSLAPVDQTAQAVADTGILTAGVLAFAASGWLLFAFGQAGDPGGR